MKKLLQALSVVFVFSLIIGSCTSTDDSTGPSDGPTTGATFLMIYKDASNVNWLATVAVSGGKYSLTKLTTVIPSSRSCSYIDYRDGKVVMYTDGGTRPTVNDERYAIAWLDIKNPGTIKYAPYPTAQTGYVWSALSACPKFLPDGKVIFGAKYREDRYEGNHWDEYILWDPVANTVMAYGDMKPFVLAQPDIGPDTEQGDVYHPYATSPDGKYFYGSAYGWGYDLGQYHQDYAYLLRCDVQSKSFARLYSIVRNVSQLGNPFYVWFVSGDGNWLVFSNGGKIKKMNLATGVASDVGTWYYEQYYTGHFASKGSSFIKYWLDANGGGVQHYDLTTGASIQVVQGNSLPDSLTRGYHAVGGAAQITADGSSIYFTAEKGYNYFTGNYDFMVMRTTPKTLSTAIDTLGVLPVNFNKRDYMVMILLE